MFSFFKRGKSKDDSDKKDKTKDKPSFSPFTKRHDSKKDLPASSSALPYSSSDSSLASDTLTCSSTVGDTPTSDTFSQLTQQIPTATPDTTHKEIIQTTDKETPVVTKDEQQCLLTSCNISNVVDSGLVVSDEDLERTVVSEVFERAGSNGSSDRTDSDTGFKTAPNTPVLTKHLIVTSEVVIDSPHREEDPPYLAVETSYPVAESADIVKQSSVTEAKDSLETRLNLPGAAEEESSDVESTKFIVNEPEQTPRDCPKEEKEECSWQENAMCEELSHCAGELYDIAEEESSEDEEEKSEEEEDDDDDDDEEDSGNVTQPTIEEEYPEEIFKKNQVNQEVQVGDLTARLCAQQLESNKLLSQIDELQRDVMVKTGGMDRLQAELSAAHKESEFVHKRLRKVEEDLESFRQRNAELTEELEKRCVEVSETEGSEGFDFNHLLELEEQVKELTIRVKELEEQLECVKKERERLDQKTKQLESEREEERRIVQEALDEALAEKEAIQTRFEKDFEKLRTVNTDREQQLLDDFEWKLREVEQACKRRLEEKEKLAQQRIQAMENKLKAAEQDLAQINNLKQYEAEAEQLRGLNLEQQRALRIAERTKEQLQVSEKVLQEEVKKLKELLDKEKAALTTMQAIHNREIDEKDRKMKFRLEQQKAELNNQWEEKLRKETIRLRIELDQLNRDEKKMVLEASRLEKEGELQKAKEKWDKQFQELIKEIDALKQKMAEKEEEHKTNIETARTNADRDIFELRRKLDRIDLSYQEKIEKMQYEHEREKERLVEESEQRMQSCEQSWQLQLGSTRTTLELVKEQLKREAADQLQALDNNHRRQLEEQWEQLTQERDETVAALEEKHLTTIEQMKNELEAAYKCRNSREQELAEVVTRLRQELCGKTSLVGELSNQAESLKNNIQELNQQIVSQEEQFQQTKDETETKLRLMEECHRQQSLELMDRHQQETERWRTSAEQLQTKVTKLTKQLEESHDTTLVENLRKALGEKEHQVAQLSKEKHLYQLELMNRNCHGETVTARQRRKSGRGGKPSKPGPSRGQHK